MLKAGLIGCGARGTTAVLKYLKAGPNLKIVTLGDVLKDHMDTCRENLAKSAAKIFLAPSSFTTYRMVSRRPALWS